MKPISREKNFTIQIIWNPSAVSVLNGTLTATEKNEVPLQAGFTVHGQAQ